MHELVNLFIIQLINYQTKSRTTCPEQIRLRAVPATSTRGIEKKRIDTKKKLIVRQNLALPAQQDDARLRAVLLPQ
jgi:hypothetical protein